MTKSLQSFLNGIIDYAGLFPPASLPLDTAIHNYARYRESGFSWMLSKFIIPAGKLNELLRYKENVLQEGDPFSLSVLGSYESTIEQFQSGTDRTLDQIKDACDAIPGRLFTDLFEVKLPQEITESEDEDSLLELINETATRFEQQKGAPQALFYELIADDNIIAKTEIILSTLSGHNEIIQEEFEQTRFSGFKLRCGGTSPEDFPSIDTVAQTLILARDYLVPLKFTAGLHHPIRHYDRTIKTMMHGFLNIFGAGIMAYAHHLTENELIEILSDEDPDSFSFENDQFSWKDYSVNTGEIEELRSIAFLSYGSCNFKEPVEDLRKLGLL